MAALIGINTVATDTNGNKVIDETLYGELNTGSIVDIRDSLSEPLDEGVKAGALKDYVITVYDVAEVVNQQSEDGDESDSKKEE